MTSNMNPVILAQSFAYQARCAHEIWWVFWRHTLPMVQSSGTVQVSTSGVVQANPLVSLHRQIEVGYPFVSAILAAIRCPLWQLAIAEVWAVTGCSHWCKRSEMTLCPHCGPRPSENAARRMDAASGKLHCSSESTGERPLRAANENPGWGTAVWPDPLDAWRVGGAGAWGGVCFGGGLADGAVHRVAEIGQAGREVFDLLGDQVHDDAFALQMAGHAQKPPAMTMRGTAHRSWARPPRSTRPVSSSSVRKITP